MFRRTIACSCAFLFLSGCLTPVVKTEKVDDGAIEAEAMIERALWARGIDKDIRRLQRVGKRILSRAASLCGNRLLPYDGFEIMTADSIARYAHPDQRDKYRLAIASELGLNDLPKVVQIEPGSPADVAGVKVGDIFLGIDDWSMPVRSSDPGSPYISFSKKKAKLPKFSYHAKTLVATKSYQYRFLRDGKEIELPITPIAACAYKLGFSLKYDLNAFADGKQINMNSGIIRWFNSDDEMAFVIAHELSHNLMNHLEKGKINQAGGMMAGMVVDLLMAGAGVNTQGEYASRGASVGHNAYSPEFETEADYVGLYAAQLAGYDISVAPNLWRRMSVETGGIDYTSSHPRKPARALQLAKGIKEIQAKVAANKPLIPELDPERLSSLDDIPWLQEPNGKLGDDDEDEKDKTPNKRADKESWTSD